MFIRLNQSIHSLAQSQ